MNNKTLEGKMKSMIALAGLLIAAPISANATVYRLDAVYSGGPHSLGTVDIDPTIVDAGSLGLFHTCPQFGGCTSSGPWDQVTFNLTAQLQSSVTSDGPGAIANFRLAFGADGDVTGGLIELEAPESGPGVPYLSASLGGIPQAPIDPGSCSGTELCGAYIPSPGLSAVPISLTFAQQTQALGAAAAPIPEPPIGWPLMLAGFVGLAWFAGVRH